MNHVLHAAAEPCIFAGAFITEKALKHIGIIFKVDAWGGLTDLTRDPKALFTISKAMKTSPNPVSWHKSVRSVYGMVGMSYILQIAYQQVVQHELQA